MKRKYNNPMREGLRETPPRTFLQRMHEIIWHEKYPENNPCTTGYEGTE